MTEEEAKRRWCPFVRAVTGRVSADGTSEHVNGQPTYNRVVDGPVYAFPQAVCCIASACMAWRFRAPQVERVQTGLGRMPVEPFERYVQEGWRQVERPRGEEGLFYERTISDGGGYCGLAGAPQ